MGGGPKTVGGKAVAKLNATTHGMRASVPVIPGETVEAWDGHRTAIVDALVPVGAMEDALAERVGLLMWRLGRVARYETESVTLSHEAIDRTIVQQWKYSHEPYETTEHGRTLDEVQEMAQLHREEEHRFRRFMRLADDRTVRRDDALHIISEVAERVGVDEEEFTYPSLPGIPDDGDIEDVKRWTAGMVRVCLTALANEAEEPVDDLLEACAKNADRTALSASVTALVWERQTERYRRERMLPEGADLERVMRYEAHLHKQLVQTMHELEAMQDRRRGHAAPLARLDVSGLDAAG